MVEGYCVKCRVKQSMVNGNEITMNGRGGVQRRAMKGSCPECNTTMFRILGKA